MSVQTSQQQIDTFYKLTSNQIDSLRGMILRFEKLIESSLVDENTYKTITNIYQELGALREYYIVRLLNGLKRGDKLG